MTKEASFVDYLHIVIKWRRFILINFFIVCILAAGISLILPKSYTATTTILPSEEQTLGIGLPSMLASLPIGSGMIPGLSTPGALYVAILESRTVKERVVTKLNLMEVYQSKNMEEAVEKLDKNTDIEVSVEGVVALKAMARRPQRAAAIANAYVEELDKKNTELSVAQARHNRLFIEERLNDNKKALRQAEDNYRHFQEKYKAIALPEQTKAAIEAAAKMLGEMQALEVQLDVLLSTMKPTNPKVVQIQKQITALQKQLNRMEYGSENDLEETVVDQEEPNKGLYVPFSKIPNIGLELLRLTRELKIQETIFELLTQQYEQAKIQEAKDTPTVQILDSAIPPFRKSKPRRMIFVFLMGLLALFFSLLFAFSTEYMNRIQKSTGEKDRKAIEIVNILKKDINSFRNKIFLKKSKKTV